MKPLDMYSPCQELSEKDYAPVQAVLPDEEYGVFVTVESLATAAQVLVEHACTVLPPGTYFQLRQSYDGKALAWYTCFGIKESGLRTPGGPVYDDWGRIKSSISKGE